MPTFRYDSVFVHAAFQFCGHIDEYLIANTRHLGILYFQTRFGKGGHLYRRYEDGRLVEEKRLRSSRNPVLYYFLCTWHHTRLLLNFTCGAYHPTTVLFTHPLTCFGMTLVRLLRRVKYVFWVWDYFPESTMTLKLYETFKRHCVRRCDLAFGLSPALTAKYDKKMKTVQLGVLPPARRPTAPVSNAILMVGQLRHGQGIEDLLAFLSEHGDYKLTLLGAAANGFEEVINERIAVLHLADRVTFPNHFITDEELRAAAANCFCGLALYDTAPDNVTHFADPGKVKSYLELGLPIVMTRISHSAKLLEMYHAGEVIETLADLPDAVAKIHADPEAYRAGIAAFAAAFDYRSYYDAAFRDAL